MYYEFIIIYPKSNLDLYFIYDYNNISMHEKVRSIFEVNKIIGVIVTYILELLLFLMLLPFMIWKWISARNHMIAIARAIFEVKISLLHIACECKYDRRFNIFFNTYIPFDFFNIENI